MSNVNAPSRTEVGSSIFQQVKYLLEAGHSQCLSREEALEIASWALKVAGESELQHQVLSELVELPENYG